MNTFINTTVYWHSVTYCVGRHLNRAHGRDRVLTATSSLARSLRPPLAATSTLASARWREATTFNVITTQHVRQSRISGKLCARLCTPALCMFWELVQPEVQVLCMHTTNSAVCALANCAGPPLQGLVCERHNKEYVVFSCCREGKSSVTSWIWWHANAYWVRLTM